MKLIPIAGAHGAGKNLIVDDEDFEELSRYIWYLHKTGYATSSHYGRRIQPHRLVMSANVGDPWVDHINQQPLDNRKSNLRFCTPKQNSHNSPIRMYPNANRHKYKGVYYSKDAAAKGKPSQWQVVIVHEGKHMSFGYHKTAEDAAEVYNREIVKLRSDWAHINVIDV